MVKKILIGFGVTVLLLALAFILFPKFWFKIINPIGYEMKEVRTVIKKEKIELDFDVILNNAYFLDYYIDSVTYDIYFDSTKFSHGSKVLQKQLTKGKPDTIQLPLVIDRGELKPKMNSLNSGDSTELIIKFKAYVDLPVIQKTEIPFKVNKVIRAPELPEFNVVSVNKRYIEREDAEFSIDFEVNNKNDYQIKIKDVGGKIEFYDLFTGRPYINEMIDIKPNTKSTFTAIMNIDNLELVRDGLRVAFRPNKMWPFKVHVNFTVLKKDGETMNIELMHESEMELMGRRKDN